MLRPLCKICLDARETCAIMKVIGVTGGIATGKSRTMQLLREYGAVVFSADEAARAVLAPGSAVLAEISETFGSSVLNPDGTLNRNRLGAMVFADANARESLNRITHPPILRLLHDQIQAARTDLPEESFIAVEVPLLYETHLEDWFDCVLTVAASEPVQIARLMQRNGLSEENARQRIAAQIPLAEKIRRSDFVLWNDGSEEKLKNNLKKFIFQQKEEVSGKIMVK